MASFIIHNIAGETLLKKIECKYNLILSEEEKTHFLLGNLMPDAVSVENSIYKTSLQLEKNTTHFRNTKTKLNILIPDTKLFIKKYSSLFNNIDVLGYLFHLYTDRIFYKDFLTSSLKGKKETDIKNIFNPNNTKGIYNDYTKINKILLNYYGTNFNKEKFIKYSKTLINPGIEEVDYSNVVNVINLTEEFINESIRLTDTQLNILKEKEIINFIDKVINDFLEYLFKPYKNILFKRKGERKWLVNWKNY